MIKQFFEQPSQVHCSDHYDPNHPDADWSGFVSSRSCRKHIPVKPDQLAITPDGNSFGPRNGVSTAEWTKPARKIVGHRQSDAEGHSADQDVRSSTFSLIGGPVPSNSPSKFAPECWETEAQAAAKKRKTELEQLTDNGRSMHVRGRKSSVTKCSFEPKSIAKDQQTSGNTDHAQRDPSDLIGFRTGNSCRVTCTDSSFLTEVGEAVKNLKDSGLFVTNPVTPFDPYKSASGERKKDLLFENFSSVVPGYTGKRTFIN